MLEIVVCCKDANLRKWIGDVIGEYSTLHYTYFNVNLLADGGCLPARMEAGFRFHIVILEISVNTESTGPPDLALPVKIRSRDRNCAIIFVAESNDYALWGYSVHAFDYWLKPLDKRYIMRTIDDAAGVFLASSRDVLPIRGKGFNTPVRYTNIIYIESVKHRLRIHMENGSVYEVYGKLGDYEQRLMASGLFLRCHQSFLVNTNHVQGISERDFIMTNGARIPIRKSSAAKLKKEYYSRMSGNRQ